MCRQWLRSGVVGAALPCGDRRELGSRRVTRVIRDRCKQGFHRHVSNNTGFMNFQIETAAAFPSRTVAAFPLTSTVQSSLDPLSVNDPWASAVAVRPVQQQQQQQQQHQAQVPLWSQLQGTVLATTVVNTTFATWIDRTTANNVARYVT